MDPRRRAARAPGLWASGLLALALAAGACKARSTGELQPPPGAEPWDPRLEGLFDDRFTPTPIALTGRAPGDVVDQRRFSQRLGYADLVLLVTVDQVWSKALYGGQPQQRVEVTLGRPLRGKLPRSTKPGQVLVLRDTEELPSAWGGKVMLLFVRWSPGDLPGYHHHLLPAGDEVVALIEAMVRHARAAGELKDEAPGRKRRKRARKGDDG